jgi:hypothetical protein
MLKKEDQEVWQSIRAPEDLAERIAAARRAEEALLPMRRMRVLRQISAAAACLVLMVGISAAWLGQRNDVAVRYDGMPVTEAAINIPEKELTVLPDDFAFSVAPAAYSVEGRAARTDAVIRIPLDLTLDRETTLRFSGGDVEILDPETEALLSTDLCYTTDRDVRIVWELPADAEGYVLELERAHQTDLLTLVRDEESGWALRCEEQSDEAGE